MFFSTPGLDIAVVITILNILSSSAFLLRMNSKPNPQQFFKKIVSKNSRKTITEEGHQIKVTVQNQTPQQFNNDTEQANTQKIQAEHHPQSSALIFSPSSKNTGSFFFISLENENLFSTNRQTQRVSIVPMLQIQKPQIKAKQSNSNNHIPVSNTASQHDQNKSIIKQLQDHPSFAASKIVQCQPCKADDGIEQSDDIVTIERNRNMSIPNELQDDIDDQEKKEQIEARIAKEKKDKRQENYNKFITIQNYFLLFSSLFFIQFVLIKINERTDFYNLQNIKDEFNQNLVTAAFGALFFNVFYGLITQTLEALLNCNKIVIRLFFYIYNIIMPFYLVSTLENQNYSYNQQYLILLGSNYFISFIFFILCKIVNWKSYPLTIFWNF